jgi:hypothetical protein
VPTGTSAAMKGYIGAKYHGNNVKACESANSRDVRCGK